MVRAPILAFPTESGDYVLHTDASNFGLVSRMGSSVLSPIIVALYNHHNANIAPQREMLAVVSMCIQFCSYLRGARFTLRTDHKSLVWLHRFKDTEGMMARWLHTRDWRGAGFTRGPAVPRGALRGGHLHISAVRVRVRVRAYDIACGADVNKHLPHSALV